MKFRTDRWVDKYKWCPNCGTGSAKRFRKCRKCGATLATANEWAPRKELEPAAQEPRRGEERIAWVNWLKENTRR